MSPIRHLEQWQVWLLVLTLTLLQALGWQWATPPWTAPDEPGHYLYVRLYAETGHPPTPTDITPAHWRALLASLEKTGWQTYIHGPQHEPIAQDSVLAASGLQISQKAPGYYALAANWLKLHPHWQTMPLVAQWRWLRWLSVLLHLAGTTIALLLGTHLWPHLPRRTLSLGLLTGILPMVGFVSGSLNNDALTLLWGAASFTALLLADTPRTKALALMLILPGPLLIDVTLLFLWPLTLWHWWPAKHRRYAALALLGLLLLLPNPRHADGWRWRHTSCTRNQGQLFLRAHTDAGAQMMQILSGKDILRRNGQTLHLVARTSGQGGPLILRLRDASHSSEIICPPSPETITCQLDHQLGPGSQHISLSARLPAGTSHFRLSLKDATGRELLRNGDGQHAALLGAPLFTWLEQHLPLPAGYFSRIFNPGIWSIPALMRYTLYAGFTWASFWGYFGWLSRPWPLGIYLFLALATLFAGAGYWHQRLTSPLRLALLALIFILAQTWLPMLGSAWQPQGRYLFPALLPISLLLLAGWQHLLGPHRHQLPHLLLPTLILLNLLAWQIVR